MKWLAYIQYFFYIAFYWNTRLALIVIYHEIKGERTYNINTTGHNNLKHVMAEGKDISHATIYMPASYNVLEAGFNTLQHHPKKHFVDIGCGKGRAMSVALASGFEKITGIDFSHQLTIEAQHNMEKAMESFGQKPVTILCEDAMHFAIPADADCIFLFNPFDEYIVKQVANNINKSLKEYPRKLTIMYANPLYKECFVEQGFRETAYIKKLRYLEMSIMEWQ